MLICLHSKVFGIAILSFIYHKLQDLIRSILRGALLLVTELVNVKQLEQQRNMTRENSAVVHENVAGESCTGTAVIHLKELFDVLTII